MRRTALRRQGQSKGVFDHGDIYVLRNQSDDTINTFVGSSSKLLRTHEKCQTAVYQKAYGIKFNITDNGALEAAMAHHQARVQIHKVERLMVPFWLTTVQAVGNFRATVLQKTRSISSAHNTVWTESPSLEFSYPFGDHIRLNQVAGTYAQNIPMLEECLRGEHIPSMLIARWELLEYLEEMKVPPKLLPFDRTTQTATDIVRKRIDKPFVDLQARKELRKYHGDFIRAHIQYSGIRLGIEKVRPVFLPLYKLDVSTKYHAKVIPTLVCGATGKATGPIISLPKKKLISMSVASGMPMMFGGVFFMEPVSALAATAGVGVATMLGTTKYRHAKAQMVLSAHEINHIKAKDESKESDEKGWKWTVEEEEKHEYMYREELREKARKRAEFEQRVREETTRERMEMGASDPRYRAYRRARSSMMGEDTARDPDPSGYYRILGLTGRERTATAKDVQQAFRIEAQKNHPDVYQGNEQDANEAMQRILEAYNILRDVKLRKEYDSGALTRRMAEDN